MKTALIVDDSRVARAVLRKTLIDYGIGVDEVPSAEAAIEYLKVDRPDVIFLDHMMPGMDGFDALEALKANPGTATIPVMMYTSQEGRFYVSQARALGAVDVMPKGLAPADVERVLRSHHLIAEPHRKPVYDEQPSAGHHDELIERFRTMLDDQAAALMADFKREIALSHSASSTELNRMIEAAMPKPASPFYRQVASGASVAVLAAAMTIGIAYLREPPLPGTVGEAPDLAAAASEPASSAAALERGRSAAPEPTSSTGAATPAALPMPQAEPGPGAGTAAPRRNFTQYYPYDAAALDDDRARELAPIFAELRSEGVAGTVVLDIHEGRFCINYSSDGSAQLAPPDQLATACDYIGTLTSSTARSQSPMFASMMASMTRDGQLQVETVWHGTAEPVIDYPVLDQSVTAGFWNSIAEINHRISIRLGGEDPIAAGERVASLTR
jgi:CheY-like chemotaxis protein